MTGLVLAESIQLDGGALTLIALAGVAMLGVVALLCWVSYQAGGGNRIAQVIVGIIAAYLVFGTVTQGLYGGPPLLAILVCAGIGWFGARQ